MNSDEIFDAIEEVAAAKGKEKQTILTKYVDDDDFMLVMKLMLDPFITFGMTKIPQYEKVEDGLFGDGLYGALNLMALRDLTGNKAITAISNHLAQLSDKSAELLIRIIRKDAKAGFTSNTINKVKKKFFKEFPYMRCSLTSKVDIEKELDWKRGVISQEKADGTFANVNNEEGGHVEITSRQGSPYPTDGALGDFVEEVKERLASGKQYHGEFLVALNGEILPREKSNGVMNRILSGGEFEEGEQLHYKIWDAIPLEKVVAKGKHVVEYANRLGGVIRDLRTTGGVIVSVIDTRIVHTVQDAYDHYFEMLAQGKEGTVIKEPSGIWKDGTSKQQIKLKLDVDVDLVVVGIVEGKVGGKNEGRPGFIACESGCGELCVDVAVKNEKMRDHVEANPEEWLGKVIVVRSNQILSPSKSNDSHTLFLPRMVEAEYRADKHIADSLESIKDQFDAAMGLESKK